MPGDPVAQPPITLPGILNYTKYTVEVKKPKINFMLNYFDLPPQAVREISFEERVGVQRDKLIEELNGTVLAETRITLDGNEGRELRIITGSAGLLIERIYLARTHPNHRMFVVMAVGKSVQPGQGDTAKFFDSFQILPPGPLAFNPVNPNPVLAPIKPDPLPSSSIVAHGLPVEHLVLSPDNRTMASADKQMLKIWDPAVKDNRPRAEFTFLDKPVKALAFSPDSKWLAVSHGTGAVILRDGFTGQEKKKIPMIPEDAVRSGNLGCLAFAPDGTTLAAGVADSTGEVILWDLGANKPKHSFTAHNGGVRALAWSPNGEALLTAGKDNVVRCWHINPFQERKGYRGHTGEVLAVALSSDGKILASGSADRTVMLWDMETGLCRGQLKGHTAEVLTVALSPDGTLVASGGADATRRLWDVNKLQERVVLKQGNGRVQSLVFSKNGATLFSTYSGMIQVWEAAKVLQP
jgi:WD40 repeat protein